MAYGDPGSGILPTGVTYPELELRRRIALAMLSQKRGYPKTLGEGLTAVGDAIGDIGTMRGLQEMERARAADLTEKAGSPTSEKEGRPGPRSEADTEPPIRTAARTPVDDEEYITPTRALRPPPQAAALTPPLPPPPQPQPPQPVTGPQVARMANMQSAYREPDTNQPFFPPPTASSPGPAQLALGQTPGLSMASPGGRQTGMMQDTSYGNALYRPGPGFGDPFIAEVKARNPVPNAGGTVPGSRSMAGPNPQDIASASEGLNIFGSPGGGPPGPPTASLDPRAGVPQPNPTQAAEASPLPSTLQASLAGSPPEAADNRPIPFAMPHPPVMSDAMSEDPALAEGTRLAAGPRTPDPNRSVQVPQTQPAPGPGTEPGRVTPPPPAEKPYADPGPFLEEPKLRPQILNERNLEIAKAQGDPQATAIFEQKVRVDEEARKLREAARLKTWEATTRAFQEQKQRNVEYGRTYEKSQAETTSAQAAAAQAAEDAAIKAQSGMDPRELLARFDKDKPDAEGNVSLLRNAQIARQALQEGVIYGIGGEFQVNWARAKAFFGDVSASELAARTEQMQAATRAMVKYGLNQYQKGDSRVTEGDLKAAGGITGGDITKQKQTQERLINMIIEDSRKNISEYERKHDVALGGRKPEEYYRLRTDPLHPDPAVAKFYIDTLLKPENIHDDYARQLFDEKFGPGAADLEIARHERRTRRGR